ncbi:MAG: amino acid permease [Candidatus Omnitrophica bacterium]|nr:amino acid permease [Candidatus Omnitrophota bacterium]
MSAQIYRPASSRLKRQLGFWDAVAINVGIIIGVGIFRVPAQVAQYLHSPSWILCAWLVGGLVSLLGVLCYAELSSCFPETGGTYVYLREAYGRLTGFVYGWIEFSILRAGSLAGVAYIFTTYLKNFIPFPDSADRFIAIFAIAIFTVVNIAGIKVGTRVQNVLSTLKVAAILFMAALVFAAVRGPFFKDTSGGILSNGPGLSLFATALIPTLWSYGGWNESTFMAGEFKDTKKDLQFALITSILIVAAVYITINIAYLKVVTPAEMMQSKAIASEVLTRLFGETGKIIVTAAVLISASGALNSNVMTGGRIPFAVGSDHVRFKWLGEVHGKYETPHQAFLANGVWAAILVLWGNFEQIVFFCGFAKWLVFALAGISVFILRKHGRHKESFAMIGYPIVPILFTLVSAGLCLTVILHTPREAMFGALLVATGIPIYFLTGCHQSKGKK